MRRAFVLAASLLLITACGTQAVTASSPSVAAVADPLGTSLVTAQGTWAIAVMGGSIADNDNFWELFVRPAGASTWRLVTPPAVADNGGLVAAGQPGSMLIGFRPSQDLTFSPLASSTSTGQNWTPGLIDATLANVPDALATAPGQRELALLRDGTIDESTNGGTTWSALPPLATSAAGRSCRLVTVNAVEFWQNGTPVAAGTCARAGVSGVFLETGGRWQAAGPLLPAAYARDRVQVLRLSQPAVSNGKAGSTKAGSTKAGSTVALLQAGRDLLATWWTGTAWAAPAAIPAAGVRTAGFGPDGSAWVLLDDGTALTISGPGASWTVLPVVPDGTAVIALGTVGTQALAVHGSKLEVWRLDAGSWTKAQAINVPIQYGSSS